jgi:hypothetical protein
MVTGALQPTRGNNRQQDVKINSFMIEMDSARVETHASHRALCIAQCTPSISCGHYLNRALAYKDASILKIRARELARRE